MRLKRGFLQVQCAGTVVHTVSQKITQMNEEAIALGDREQVPVI